MMRELPKKISDDVRRLNPDLFPDQGIMAPEEEKKAKAYATRLEEQMQNQVENWLHHRGYWRRTPDRLQGNHGPAMGWQVHLHVTKRNPLLLDVLLLDNRGRYLEVELKPSKGARVRDHQAFLVRLCRGHLACSFTAFVDLVEEWEAEAS